MENLGAMVRYEAWGVEERFEEESKGTQVVVTLGGGRWKCQWLAELLVASPPAHPHRTVPPTLHTHLIASFLTYDAPP